MSNTNSAFSVLIYIIPKIFGGGGGGPKALPAYAWSRSQTDTICIANRTQSGNETSVLNYESLIYNSKHFFKVLKVIFNS